jgi:hypothetical protein
MFKPGGNEPVSIENVNVPTPVPITDAEYATPACDDGSWIVVTAMGSTGSVTVS